MFTLTPKHADTLPYFPQIFNKIIQLPVHLSKIVRGETFSNDSNHSAFCPGIILFAQTSGKYSKCQLAVILYNAAWTANAMMPI